jgi:hypothetical protein
MKEINIKDVEVKEVVEESKKFNVKSLVLIILLVVTSLVGVFFLSTKIRWNAEIAEKEFELLYYGQDNIKVEELLGFFGNELDTQLKENEAFLMYCNSEYGGYCVTGDFNNSFENMLRNPGLALNIVILIDLILLFMLLRDKKLGIKVYIIFGALLFYGIINVGRVIFEVVDYYYLINKSENVVEGNVIAQLFTENKEQFYPVVEYTTEQGDFVNYIKVPMEGQLKDSKLRKVNVYYDKKDNDLIINKQGLKKQILPLIIGVGYIVLSIVFLVNEKKNNREGI